MAILVLGILLWMAIHLLKPAMPERRAALAARYGEGPVKGVAALGLVLSIGLMVIGWQWMFEGGAYVYVPPSWGWHLNNLLMLLAFILLGAGHAKSSIRRFVRHPMLTAVLVWAVAHLIANGELRAVILFSGMFLWAALSILFINRRDGAWVVPPPSPRRTDIIHLVASAVLFLGFALIHPYLFGVSPFPG